MSLDRPIVVTGTPRSGKSLIARILNDSGEFTWVSEPLSIWDAGLSAKQSDDLREARDATEEVVQDIRNACRRRIHAGGGRRYLDDLAYHAIRIPFLFEVLPDVRVIHVIRDARDVIPEMLFGWTYRDTIRGAVKRRWRGLRLRSLPRLGYRFIKNYLQVRGSKGRLTWGPRVPGLESFRRSHSMAEVAAYQWLHMVKICRTALKAKSSDSWLEIKHEELVADPENVGMRLARFAGAADPASISAAAQDRIQPDFRFDRKVMPTDEQWTSIGQLIDEYCDELGYAARAA